MGLIKGAHAVIAFSIFISYTVKNSFRWCARSIGMILEF